MLTLLFPSDNIAICKPISTHSAKSLTNKLFFASNYNELIFDVPVEHGDNLYLKKKCPVPLKHALIRSGHLPSLILGNSHTF